MELHKTHLCPYDVTTVVEKALDDNLDACIHLQLATYRRCDMLFLDNRLQSNIFIGCYDNVS